MNISKIILQDTHKKGYITNYFYYKKCDLLSKLLICNNFSRFIILDKESHTMISYDFVDDLIKNLYRYN